MRKTVSGIILILLLMGMLTLAFNVQPVKASPGTIYIRADGSVEGTTSIQTADNVTYVFTANINASLVVERNNIITDGNGYTLQGTREHDSKGVDLSGRTNVTIHNATIKAFYYGIWLNLSSSNILSGNNITANNIGICILSSSNNTVIENKITNNWYGIWLGYSSSNILSGNNITHNLYGIVLGYSSSNNIVSGNNITANNDAGIWLVSSSNNTVSGNNITANNLDGIWLVSSSNNTLAGNIMTNNCYSFGVEGLALSDFVNDVDTSNMVDGKPVYYWVNRHDMTVPLNAGTVVLANCTRITVQNLNLTRNRAGILLAYTTDSTITQNNIANNYWGIWFVSSSNNTIYHNNFVDNSASSPQVSSSTSMNVWDDGYPSGGNYWNYWGYYTGVDLKNGPGQNQTGSDGIDDARYKIDENNIDRYPLMCPFNRFDAGTWSGVAYNVGVVSNSTVSGFSFNPEAGPFIRFNATGSSGTIGFSRVAIPKQLLCVKPPAEWIVEIGGVQVTPTVTEDANYTYLYFTYTHSTKTIQITGTNVVPEFPPATTMLLLMIFTLLAVAFAKKRLPRPKSGNHHFSLSSR